MASEQDTIVGLDAFADSEDDTPVIVGLDAFADDEPEGPVIVGLDAFADDEPEGPVIVGLDAFADDEMDPSSLIPGAGLVKGAIGLAQKIPESTDLLGLLDRDIPLRPQDLHDGSGNVANIQRAEIGVANELRGEVPVSDAFKERQFGKSMVKMFDQPVRPPADFTPPFEIARTPPRAPKHVERSPSAFLADVVEGGIQGMSRFVGGMARIYQLTDLTDPYLPLAAEAFSRTASSREEQLVAQDPSMVRGAVRGAVSSLTQMAPAAFSGGLAAGAQAGGFTAIGAAGVTTANDAINSGLDAGMTGKALEQYVSDQAVMELGPAAVMQAAGLGGLERMLGNMTGGVRRSAQRGVVKALDDFGVNLMQELPEELVTEIGQNLSDYGSGIDLEAMDAAVIADTSYKIALQTFLAVGMANLPSGAKGTVQTLADFESARLVNRALRQREKDIASGAITIDQPPAETTFEIPRDQLPEDAIHETPTEQNEIRAAINNLTDLAKRTQDKALAAEYERQAMELVPQIVKDLSTQFKQGRIDKVDIFGTETNRLIAEEGMDTRPLSDEARAALDEERQTRQEARLQQLREIWKEYERTLTGRETVEDAEAIREDAGQVPEQRDVVEGRQEEGGQDIQREPETGPEARDTTQGVTQERKRLFANLYKKSDEFERKFDERIEQLEKEGLSEKEIDERPDVQELQNTYIEANAQLMGLVREAFMETLNREGVVTERGGSGLSESPGEFMLDAYSAAEGTPIAMFLERQPFSEGANDAKRRLRLLVIDEWQRETDNDYYGTTNPQLSGLTKRGIAELEQSIDERVERIHNALADALAELFSESDQKQLEQLDPLTKLPRGKPLTLPHPTTNSLAEIKQASDAIFERDRNIAIERLTPIVGEEQAAALADASDLDLDKLLKKYNEDVQDQIEDVFTADTRAELDETQWAHEMESALKDADQVAQAKTPEDLKKNILILAIDRLFSKNPEAGLVVFRAAFERGQALGMSGKDLQQAVLDVIRKRHPDQNDAIRMVQGFLETLSEQTQRASQPPQETQDAERDRLPTEDEGQEGQGRGREEEVAQPTQRERTLSDISERAQQLEQEPTGQVTSEEILGGRDVTPQGQATLDKVLEKAPKNVVLLDEVNENLVAWRDSMDIRKAAPGASRFAGIKTPSQSGLTYEDFGLEHTIPGFFQKTGQPWDVALELAYEMGVISEEERTDPATIGKLLTGSSRSKFSINLGEKEQAIELFGSVGEAVDGLLEQRKTLVKEGSDTSAVDRLIRELEAEPLPEQQQLFTEEDQGEFEEEWLFSEASNLRGLPALAKIVLQSIQRLPKEAKFGEPAFIHKVHEQVQVDTGQKLPLDTFKRLLVELNKAGYIVLKRADLVAAMDPEMVRASETKDMHATFNFVRPDDPRGLLDDEHGVLHAAPPTTARLMPLDATPGVPITRISEIRRFIEKVFDATLRGKATQRYGKNVAGVYEVHPDVIRVFQYDDLETLAHEVAHRLNAMFWGLRRPGALETAQFRGFTELNDLDYDQTKRRSYEGFAEYMRHWLFGDPVDQFAPKFHDWFQNQFLPTVPKEQKNLERLRTMYFNYAAQGARNRGEAGIVRKQPKEINRFTNAYLKLLDRFTDTFASLEYLMAKEGFVHASPKNLRYKNKKGFTVLEADEDPIAIGRFFKEKAPAMARRFVLDEAFGSDGNRVGPSLASHLNGVRPRDIEDFTIYLRAKRDLVLHQRGLYPGQHFIDDLHNVETFEKLHPDWAGRAVGITEWTGALLQHLVDAGGLSLEEQRRIQDLNPIYFNFNRILESGQQSTGRGGSGVADRGKPIKRIRGGSEPIEDPLTALMEYAERILEAANKVRVGAALARLSKRNANLGNLITRVATPVTPQRVRSKDVVRALIEQGAIQDEADIESGNLDDILTFWTTAPTYDGKENIVSFWVNGRQEFYEIHKQLWDTLKNMDTWQLGWGFGFLTKFARATKLGAVQLRAGFSIANPMRDSATLLINHEHVQNPFSPVVELGRQIKANFTDDELLAKFERGGGKMTGFIGHDMDVRKDLRDELVARASGNIARRAAVRLHHPIDLLRDVMGVTESMSRTGEFRAAYKWAKRQGMSDSGAWIYAGNAAADVTINFTRAGSWGRNINQVIPFWNVAIQEPSKMARQLTQRPVRTIARGLFWLTAPTMALWWFNKDDERYRELYPWQKAMFWNFWIGDQHYMLPKPFGWGHIFASGPEAYWASNYERDPEQFGDIMKAAVEQSLFDVAPPPVRTWYDIKSNKSWSGMPIIPRELEDYPPYMQYTQWTPEIYKKISEQLALSPAGIDVSPAHIDYALSQLTGGATGAMGRTVEAVTDRIEGKPGELRNVPAIGRFAGRDFRPSRSQELFYRELKELKQYSNGLTPEVRDKMTQAEKDEGNRKLLRLQHMESIETWLRTINKGIKEAQAAEDGLWEDAYVRAKATALQTVLNREPTKDEILDTSEQ